MIINSNPLDAYLWNAKTVEVHKGRGEPYTIIEHLKRRIKKNLTFGLGLTCGGYIWRETCVSE